MRRENNVGGPDRSGRFRGASAIRPGRAAIERIKGVGRPSGR